jgi:tRNA pseudouridine55 synthase
VHEQVPPVFSAIKKDGRTAYEMARKGQAPVMDARTIEVVRAQLAGVRCDPVVVWDVELSVSKGTYVRALARDLGRDLGTAAHLGALRRMLSGAYSIEDAKTLEQIESAGPTGIGELFADPVIGVGLQGIELNTQGASKVAVGARLEDRDFVPGLAPGDRVAVTHSGRLLAVYAREGSSMKAVVVIPDGVGGGRS